MMSSRARIRIGTLVATALFVIAPHVLAASPVWTVTSASQATVTIDPAATVRAKLPRTLYSFNMRYNLFERELFDTSTWHVKTPIATALLPLAGVYYRYPGGLLGNHFDWERAALSRAQREAFRAAGESANTAPYFGPAEYLTMVKQNTSMVWWTLNLLGRGSDTNPIELPSSAMAASNKKLAQYLKTNYPAQTQWIYQLGNELERNIYEWPHAKYVSRSLDSINAMRTVDPNAKFVAFMRDYNIKYKTRSGSSTAAAYFKDVMTGLPMVNDFSLHFYYDGKLSPNSKFVTVPDMLGKIQNALSLARAARPSNYSVWITEHAKRLYLDGTDPANPNALDNGISVGDFILALTQVPEVQGANLQGLQGLPRTTFFNDTLAGTPAFWTLRMLNAQPYERVLASRTTSPNKSAYPGGYDVRAVGFVDATGAKLGVQAINRYNQPMPLQISFVPFKGKTKSSKHYYMASAAGADPAKIDRTLTLVTAPTAVAKAFGSTGSVTVTLPPSSVSTITFE